MSGTRGLDVAAWMMGTLPSPSDPDRELVLTPDQIDLLARLYAVDDAGRYVYRRGALQGAKGIGKSPLAAMIALAELVGPTAPADPLVQIAALSEEQATSTVYSLVLQLVRANDRRVASRLGIDDGRGRLFLAGRPGKLEAVTAVAGSHEGERTTFAVLDETHLWTRQNGGAALARTIRRNVSKSGGRSLELSNACEPGRGSVAEATEADHAAGQPGILFVARRPSRLPEPGMSDDELLALLADVYGDAPWIDRRRILSEVRDAATPWSEALRYFLNTPAAAADVLVDPARWAELGTAGPIADGSRITIGFDGSHSQDATALVIADDEGRVELALLVEREPGDPPEWTVERALVHETLGELFDRFRVARLLCDPFLWRSELDEWTRLYGEKVVLSHPTNSARRFGPAVDRFRVAVAEGRLSHTGDGDLARHLANARLVRGPGRAADDGHALYTLEKAGPRRYIDAAVAACLAVEAIAAPVDVEPELRPTEFAWG